MSNLHNTIEYINSLSQSDPKELIDRSEQRFKNIIRDVSDKVENDAGLQVVMLAGPPRRERPQRRKSLPRNSQGAV